MRRRFFGYFNLGQTEFELGSYDKSLATREQSLALAEASDNELWTADALYALGETHHAINQRAEAQSFLHRALQLYEQNNANAYRDEIKGFIKKNGYTPSE